ncbi:MlaD family protein [Mycolicibacter minnesotensis]
MSIAAACAVVEPVVDPVLNTLAPPSARYCATMPDSLGLYAGNTVTRRGVPIGKIDRVEGGTVSVRVTFLLNRGIAVPAGVHAVTRSPTVVADRSLELIGGDLAAGTLRPGECIPLERTSTTRANSEILGTFTTVLRQLTGQEQGRPPGRLVKALGHELTGSGPTLRDALKLLAQTAGGAGGGEAVANQQLKEAVSLMRSATANWSTIDTLFAMTAPTAQAVADIVPPLVDFVNAELNPLVQMVRDLTTLYHDLVWNTLDAATVTLRLLSEHSGVIVMYAGTLPNILDGVRSFWARIHVNPPRPIPLVSPRVNAGRTDDGKVCSRVAPDGEDHCGLFYGLPDGTTTTDLLQLVLDGGVQQP